MLAGPLFPLPCLRHPPGHQIHPQSRGTVSAFSCPVQGKSRGHPCSLKLKIEAVLLIRFYELNFYLIYRTQLAQNFSSFKQNLRKFIIIWAKYWPKSASSSNSEFRQFCFEKPKNRRKNNAVWLSFSIKVVFKKLLVRSVNSIFSKLSAHYTTSLGKFVSFFTRTFDFLAVGFVFVIEGEVNGER